MTLRAKPLRAVLLLSGLLFGFFAAYAWQNRGRPAIVVAPTPAPAIASAPQAATMPRATPPPSVRSPPPAPPDAVSPAPPDSGVTASPTPPRAIATAPTIADAAALLVPVQGIAVDALSDTFEDARGSERRHEALDIMAPTGTPVLAVADGHVEKLFDSKQGGLTIYQFEPGGRYAYYYAHLERYAPGLAEKQAVRQGEVIGYVGSTGNADPLAPHLHFAIFVLGPERQWWKGTPINPYPLLRGD